MYTAHGRKNNEKEDIKRQKYRERRRYVNGSEKKNEGESERQRDRKRKPERKVVQRV